ncbi:MAG TPA: Ig-like domain-containing protein [Candidatus Thermoplasmatota archaeon]|nr:Ig-like domain-containing protein [Candidatus Thermoplasmatota archaeon]
MGWLLSRTSARWYASFTLAIGLVGLLLLLTPSASAQTQGGIEVTALGEYGSTATLEGAKVTLTLPGSSASAGDDVTLIKFTAANGKATWTEAEVRSGFLGTERSYRWRVEADGFVPLTGTQAYALQSQPAANGPSGTGRVSLPTVIKITVQDEFLAALPGATVRLLGNPDTVEYATLTDGGDGDRDGTANGIIHSTILPDTFTTNVKVASTRAGFLPYTTAADIVTGNAQTQYTVTHLYTVKARAEDELGNALALTSSTSTATGLPLAQGLSVVFSGGAAYLPATGSGTLSIGHAGYVTASEAVTVSPTGTAPVEPVLEDATSLKFTVKVVNAQDELGNAFTFGTDVAITSTSGTPVVSGGAVYVPMTAAGTLTATSSGFFASTTGSITPDPAAQKTVAFGGSGATVSATALSYRVKITAVEQVGNAVPLTASTTQVGGHATTAKPVRFSNGAAYLAATNASSTTLTLQVKGFVTATSAAFNPGTATSPVLVAFGTGSHPALLFTIKVDEVKDETGGTIAIVPGLVTSSVAPVVSGGVAYFPVEGGSAVELKVIAPGFVDTSSASIAAVSTAQKTVKFGGTGGTVSVSAVPFTVRVTATDELGNALTLDGTKTTVTGLPLADGRAIIFHNGVAYVPASGTGTVTLRHAGYIERTAAAPTVPSTASQIPVAFSGATALPFSVKVLAVYNELGALQSMGTVTVAAGTTTATVSGTAAYLPLEAEAQVSASKAGYATRAATVSPGTTVQKLVQFGGTAPTGVQQAEALNVTVRLRVTDTLNRGVTGFTAYFNTTSPTVADASVVEGSVNDLDGVADGRLYVAANPATAPYNQAFDVTIWKQGYPTTSRPGQTTSATAPLKLDIVMGFSLNASVRDTLGNLVPGATITIADPPGPNGGTTVVDGGAGDIDGVANGYVQIAYDVGPAARQVNVQASRAGFLASAAQTPTLSNSATATTTLTLPYSVKVTAKDEFGALLQLAAVNTTFSGVDLPPEPGIGIRYDSAGVAYVPATTTKPITVLLKGFLSETTTMAISHTGTAAQTPATGQVPTEVTFGGGQASGLRYSTKILGVDTELGEAIIGAIPASGITLGTGSTSTLERLTFQGNQWHLALSKGTAVLEVAPPGFLKRSASLTVGETTRVTVDFDVGTPGRYAAGTDGQPVLFPVRVAAVQNEFGSSVMPTTGTPFVVDGTAPAGQRVSSGVWYIPASVGAHTLTISSPGYTQSSVSLTVGSTQQTVHFDKGTAPVGVVDGEPVLARLKVVLSDELGNPITGATVTHGGVPVTNATGNVFLIPTATTSDLTVSAAGFVGVRSGAGGDTALANLATDPASQLVVTLSGATPCTTASTTALTCRGLAYTVRVNASDETGRDVPLSAAATSFSGFSVPAGRTIQYVGGAAYVPAALTAQTVTLQHSGFLPQTATAITPVSTAPTALLFATGGQGAPLPYTVKVTGASTELGRVIPFANLTVTSTVPVVVHNGAAYIPLASSGPVTVSATGFVNAVKTVTPGATQEVPSFAGADALKYQLKVTAQHEAGGAVALTEAATRIHGLALAGTEPVVFHDGAAYVPAVATPAATFKVSHTGYVDRTLTTALAPTAQSTVALAGSLAFPFTVKVMGVKDETGQSIPLAEGVISAPVPPAYSGGIAYLPLAGPGAVTATKTGYLPSTVTVTGSNLSQLTLAFDGAAGNGQPLRFPGIVQVTEAWDGNPLPGATVKLFATAARTGTPLDTLTTDTQGRAFHTRTGTLHYTVEKAGHVTATPAAVTVNPNAQTLTPVPLGGHLSLQSLQIDEATAASGGEVTVRFRVLYPDGTPVPTTVFRAALLHVNPANRIESPETTLSNSAGNYAVKIPIPATAATGTWRVSFAANAVRDGAAGLSVGPSPAAVTSTDSVEVTRPSFLIEDFRVSQQVYGRGEGQVMFRAKYVDGTPATTLTGSLKLRLPTGEERAVPLHASGDTYIAPFTLAATAPTGEWTALLPVGSATDAGGKTGPASQHVASFQVDTSAPATKTASPVAVTGGVIRVDWEATERGAAGALAKVSLYARVKTGDWALVSETLQPKSFSGSFQYTSSGEGVYRFAVVAVDTLGNAEAAPTGSTGVVTVVDTTAPESAVKALPEMSASPIEVAWSSTDPTSESFSGVASVRIDVKVDDAAWTPWLTGQPATGVALYTTAQDGQRLQFRSVATDAAGNVEAPPAGADAVTRVNLQSPVAVLDAALEGAHVRGDLAVSGTATAPSLTGWRLEVSRDGGATWSSVASGTQPVASGPLATWHTATVEDGSYRLRLTLSDANGQTAASTRSLVVDNRAPTVTLSSPLSGVLATVSVAEGRITDPNLAKAVLVLNGRELPLAVSQGRFTHALEGLAEGSHTVVVRATDRAGNVREALAEFTLDASAPHVVLSGVPDRLRAPAAVQVTATDLTLKAFEVTLDGRDVTRRVTVNGLLQLDPQAFTEGVHHLVVRAEDSLGHVTEEEAYFQVDRMAPRVALASIDQSLVRGLVTLGAAATDDDRVDQLVLLVDGKPVDAERIEGGFQLNTRTLADGSHTVAVRAVDASGNEATSPAATLRVDNTPPTLQVQLLVNAVGLAKGTPLTLEPSDLSPLAAVTLRVAGRDPVTLSAAPYTWPIDLPGGEHRVEITVTDEAGNSLTQEYTLTVLSEEEPEEPKTVPGMGVLGALAVVGAAVVLLRRRG